MGTFLDILVGFVLQILFTVGIVVLFGVLIGLCNRVFYSNYGGYGRAVCYITGVVGTPIHECAHALFCLIFGHKIVDMQLFQINSDDGTLGYVNHSYNPRNFYQRIGNFFIGVAPILVISGVLFFLAWLLMPEFIGEISASFAFGDFVDNFGNVFVSLGAILLAFFSHALSWQWWVFVFVGMMLALHMTLSKADVHGALDGLIFVLALFLVVDIVLGIVSRSTLNAFTNGVMAVGGYALCIFILALVISLIAVVISFIFRAVRRR